MRKQPRHLEQLEQALLDLGDEAMLLPVEWEMADDEVAPVFDMVDHMNKMLTLVMAHYDDMARKLFDKPERYAPFFAVDDRNGDVLWELWGSKRR